VAGSLIRHHPTFPCECKLPDGWMLAKLQRT
jgi:hypothetical protein